MFALLFICISTITIIVCSCIRKIWNFIYLWDKIKDTYFEAAQAFVKTIQCWYAWKWWDTCTKETSDAFIIYVVNIKDDFVLHAFDWNFYQWNFVVKKSCWFFNWFNFHRNYNNAIQTLSPKRGNVGLLSSLRIRDKENVRFANLHLSEFFFYLFIDIESKTLSRFLFFMFCYFFRLIF